MRLLVETLRDEVEDLFNNNIRLNAIGDVKSLSNEVRYELDKIINSTKENTGMTLTLALSYGGKQEIFKAVKEISEKVKNEIICLDNFDDSIINDHLYTKNLPDVDLLIRTSGEQRISNFLLWQIAYAELYFTNTYWPDFCEEDFTNAIIDYQKRERMARSRARSRTPPRRKSRSRTPPPRRKSRSRTPPQRKSRSRSSRSRSR